MADIITVIRIVCSVALMFCPSLSSPFYALYITAGASDMIDGYVARKTNTVSEFGSKLDTAADIFFTAACMIKLLPELDIPSWLYVWTAVIAAIKITNIVVGYAINKEFAAVHSVMNKITGALLFALPLTLRFITLKYSAAAVCVAATAAAIHEGYYIITRKGGRSVRGSGGRSAQENERGHT